ncbi:thioredoxin domain-containing protein [Caulobacter sp. UNC279MFTsu5.1]|uniref:thioredoxin domain-containing protein n=1 Tax=Caulobacter sp. UNC279MFTsu5.1 TaxID=1502775 RepID=UPI0008F33CB5|nr:thioredoxin domain-containing protein [Caulobacter sp. UNC279MFTsu5.1]SFI69860.1 Protein-disulfide isomerase [Caulobacter sp. UNC279MFTsu5.1]
MRPLTRRLLTAVALTASLGVALAGCDKKESVSADDMSLGNPNAKVTVVEYASASCIHCGRWNNEVFPDFKKKYIDTGRVHYVYREFLTEPVQVASASFLMARCAGKDKYFSVLDSVYHSQEEMFTTGDYRGVLLRIAQSAGMDEAQFTSCVTNEKNLKALNSRVEKYQADAKITGTPTFIINGKKAGGDDGGEQSMAQLDAAIAAAEAAAK